MHSKWMVEVKAGVFIAKINALVRKLLWEKCMESIGNGSLIMIWATNTEQGFDLLHHNCKDYIPLNIEGIWLTLHPLK
jgi:CRISPR-associated protein Cas2